MSSVRHILVFIVLILLCAKEQLYGYSTLRKNDPLPVYSAEYREDHVSRWERDYYRELEETIKQERVEFSLTPFRQTANEGRNIYKNRVPIGDIGGRFNMLGLFYPTNEANLGTADPWNLLPSLGLALTGTAACFPPSTDACCPSVTSNCNTGIMCTQIIDPSMVDPAHTVGFFSIPIEYRKYGLRFQTDIRFAKGFAMRLQLGAADLTQTVTAYVDLTLTSTGTTIVGESAQDATCGASGCIDSTVACKELIINNIMNKKQLLAKTLDLNIDDFHTAGLEDVILSLYWQDVIPINDECDGWPFFLCVPIIAFEAVLPTSKTVDPSRLFAVPLGDNGHAGFGFSGGFDFDFINSIEIGIHVSMTHWNSRCCKNMPVPTQEHQSGIYPFRANYLLSPGNNWTFSGSMKAHYFLDRLSAFVEYQMVSHGRDHYEEIAKIPATTTGWLPKEILFKKMMDDSPWHVHVFNVGITYDIAPHVSLGILWQAPVSRRNAYRSSTVLFSSIFRF